MYKRNKKILIYLKDSDIPIYEKLNSEEWEFIILKNIKEEDLISYANINCIDFLLCFDVKKTETIVKQNDIQIIYNEKYKKSFELATNIQCDFYDIYECELKRRNNLAILNKVNMPSIIVSIEKNIIYNHDIYQNLLNNIKKFL